MYGDALDAASPRTTWPVRRALTERGLFRAVLLAFGLLLAYRFLSSIVTALLLLGVGLLLAVALSAPVEALHHRKVPRPAATGIVFLGVPAALGLGSYLLLPNLERQVSQLVFTMPDVVSKLGQQMERLASRIGVQVGDGPSFSTLASWGRQLLGGGLALFGNLAAAVLGLVVVIFLAFYLAAMPKTVLTWCLRLMPPDHRPRTRAVLAEVRRNLLSWLKGRLISMAIIGALSTAALYLIGIPAPILLGIFAGIVEFVPYVGPVIAAVPPALLGLAGHPVDALWVIVAYVIIQQAEGYLVTPLVMSGTASLHPAAVILSVTVLGAAFGVVGALLAIPTAVVIKVLVEELWFPRVEGGRQGDPEEVSTGG